MKNKKNNKVNHLRRKNLQVKMKIEISINRFTKHTDRNLLFKIPNRQKSNFCLTVGGKNKEELFYIYVN